MIPTSIIVPLDGSDSAEHAVPVAAQLAPRLSAQLVLARSTYGSCQDARSYLDHVAVVENAEAAERIVLADESASEAITQMTRERPGSMVCMTTHGRGRLRWAFTGSVAEDVIRSTTQPSLLVGPGGSAAWSEPARRVVVCVDGTPVSALAVEHACEWATALDLEVHLQWAIHPLDVEGTEHPQTVFEPLEEIVRAQGLHVQSRQLFRSSFIAGALVDEAEDPPANLIVMAAHRHGAVSRFVLGSTTMAVLSLAPCPVLVIPPGEPETSPSRL